MYKLIILDRDGVINEDSPDFIKSPEEWYAIPGSLEAIAKLNHSGYKVVVATNQSGIARKYFTEATLEKIHAKMLAAIKAVGGKIDGIYICPHGPSDNCDCRKPKPGLLLRIAKDFHLAADQMLLIGDSQRDLQAAESCGVKAFLVKTGKGEHTLVKNTINVAVFADLAQAVDAILKTERPG
jgi:D-glycero-D-manno-heptose 1,7-bisphosphate phosphatase